MMMVMTMTMSNDDDGWVDYDERKNDDIKGGDDGQDSYDSWW